MSASDRLIEPYVRRDDISWWAGCRYVNRGAFDPAYIRETSTMTRWGAKILARRLARKARRIRASDGLGTWTVGDPR